MPTTTRIKLSQPLLLTLLCVGFMSTSTADESTLEQEQSFDIAPQALDQALLEFSDQAGVQILVAASTVEGARTDGVHGTVTRREALDTLLDQSDLEYSTVGETITVTASREASSDPGNAATTPGPMLMAQASASQATTGQTSSQSDGETSVVSGEVTDVRTGTKLKGALVTIEETGQSTSTDDLGRYRFPAVRSGDYTVRISYLGYGEQRAGIAVRRGQPVFEDFALAGGGELEEIVVFGQRSARAQALNIERTAANSSTVLSADALGSFNGTTISEALRRAPGIAFIPDPDTGDGTNIIVRGLEPDLNQIMLNGVRLLDGSGEGRSPDLGSFLTESIQSVTVNTSLLPSHDTNGAGALIEIETKGPLDRADWFASAGVEYGENGNDFGDDFLLNGTLSRTFGAESDFGISLSASYREREVTSARYDLGDLMLGRYLPAGASSKFRIDPRSIYPFEDGNPEVYPRSTNASQSATEDETLLIGGGLQKRFGEHSELRLDVTYTDKESSTYSATTSFNTKADRRLLPVDELGGELRYVLLVEDPFPPGSSSEFFFGTGLLADTTRSVSYSPLNESDTLSISARGLTSLGPWDFSYSAGYTDSSSASGGSFDMNVSAQGSTDIGVFGPSFVLEPSFLNEQVLNNTVAGLVVSTYEPIQPGNSGAFILPALTQEGFDFFNGIDNLLLNQINVSAPTSGNGSATTLGGSMRRNFDHSGWQYLELGFNYQDTAFESREGIGTRRRILPASGDVLLSALGLEFGPGILESVGADNDFRSITQSSVEGLFANVDRLIGQGLLSTVDTTRDELSVESSLRGLNETGEETLAGYIEGRFDIGKLELIGGVRVEELSLSSTYLEAPRVFIGILGVPGIRENFAERVSESASQTDVLPRLQANYRFTENMILRGSYYTTVSRPQLRNLTQNRSYFLFLRDPATGIGTDQLSVRQGNPDLEPATTHNYGLGWEWYTSSVGALKVNFFYKEIDNPLQSTQTIGDLELLPDDVRLPEISFFQNLPPDFEVRITTPVNGDTSWKLYGAEFVVERQLNMLPGLLSGLGVYINYTYTESESERQLQVSPLLEASGVITIDDVPFSGSPEYSGTAGLTYSGSGFDASLLYSIQDRRLANFSGWGLSGYDEKIDTLDLQIEYLTQLGESTLRVFARGIDLLKSGNDPYLETSVGGQFGAPTYYDGARFFGGRSFSVGASVSF